MNAAAVVAPREHPSMRVEVTRGGGVESLHRVDAVVCDSQGGCVESWGEATRPVFPRSAVKADPGAAAGRIGRTRGIRRQ